MDNLYCIKDARNLFHRQGIKGRRVIVAVIDSAIDLTHDAFRESVIETRENKGGTSIYTHGTAIASIITGKSEEILAIAPKVELINYNIFTSDSEFSFYKLLEEALDDIIQGILNKNRKVNIINMSFGSVKSNDEVARKIKQLSDLGVIMVSSAGNNIQNNKLLYPGVYKEVIQVGSWDAMKNVSDFSSSSDLIDIFVYGEDIPIAMPDNRFGKSFGTSLSTAIVSGFIALLMEKHTVDLTKEQVLKKLRKLIT